MEVILFVSARPKVVNEDDVYRKFGGCITVCIIERYIAKSKINIVIKNISHTLRKENFLICVELLVIMEQKNVFQDLLGL